MTVAIPSYNQGRFLEHALTSVFKQDIPVQVFVVDGGSVDNSLEVIEQFRDRLTGYRSHRDAGQAAAINEAIAKGRAKYVCWLNSDDWFLPGALSRMVAALEARPNAPMVYGRSWNYREDTGGRKAVWVEPFSERRLALRCIISQPATLIRRNAWESVGGVDPALQMTMDYDLWWRLYKTAGPPTFIEDFLAVNRVHDATKTGNNRRLHYREAIDLVRRHHGTVPMKWWIAQPYAVWWKSIIK